MKDLQEDNIFGSIRERLGRYEEAPSDAVWDKIAAGKNDEGAIWPLWMERAALGVMAVIIGLNIGVAPKKVLENKVNAAVERREEMQTRKGTQSTRRGTQREIHNPPVKNSGSAPMISLSQPLTRNPKLETFEEKPETVDISPTQHETRNPKLETIDSIKEQSIVVAPKENKLDEVIPPFKKPKNKFQLYLSFTPSLSFQKIIPNSNDAIIIEGFGHRSPLSVKRFGIAVDAGFQRDINRFLGFYGGLSFYQQQQQLTYRYFDREAEVTRVGDSWTFEINRPQQTRTFDYSMINLGVRSGLLVTIKGEKLKHKFGAGLIYSQGFIKSSNAYNNKNSSYLSYQLSYRSELHVNDRLSWFAEPTFVYGFLSKEKLAEPFSLKPYRAGISVGVLYRF